MTAKLIHSHGKLFMIDIKNFRIQHYYILHDNVHLYTSEHGLMNFFFMHKYACSTVDDLITLHTLCTIIVTYAKESDNQVAVLRLKKDVKEKTLTSGYSCS